MKNILYILTISVFVALNMGCKKPPVPSIDKSTTNTTEEEEEIISPYVGDWSYSSISLTNGTLSIMGQDLGTFTGEGADIVGGVTITQNPNKYTTSVSFTANINVLGAEQQLPVDTRTSSGTWTESGGKISLKDDSGQSITVISSTNSEIVFSGAFKESIDAPFGSIDATSDVVFTIVK